MVKRGKGNDVDSTYLLISMLYRNHESKSTGNCQDIRRSANQSVMLSTGRLLLMNRKSTCKTGPNTHTVVTADDC